MKKNNKPLLTLNLADMTITVDGKESSQLSPGVFKILYRLFSLGCDRQGADTRETAVDYIPYGLMGASSRGALNVLMVDVKRVLPPSAYKNVRGKGFNPSDDFLWSINYGW